MRYFKAVAQLSIRYMRDGGRMDGESLREFI